MELFTYKIYATYHSFHMMVYKTSFYRFHEMMLSNSRKEIISLFKYI